MDSESERSNFHEPVKFGGRSCASAPADQPIMTTIEMRAIRIRFTKDWNRCGHTPAFHRGHRNKGVPGKGSSTRARNFAQERRPARGKSAAWRHVTAMSHASAPWMPFEEIPNLLRRVEVAANRTDNPLRQVLWAARPGMTAALD